MNKIQIERLLSGLKNTRRDLINAERTVSTLISDYRSVLKSFKSGRSRAVDLLATLNKIEEIGDAMPPFPEYKKENK